MRKKPPSLSDHSMNEHKKNTTEHQQDKFKKQERAQMRRILNTQMEDFSAEAEKDDLNLKPVTLEERGKILTAQRQKKRQRLIKIGAWAVGIGLFIWLLIYLFSSPKQDIMYGLCKVFLEQQVHYPQHLRYRQIERIGGNSIRIWFRQVGPYGEHRMESIRCYFRIMEPKDQLKYGPIPPFMVINNQAVALVLDKVHRNRKEYYPERVEGFNRSIIAVLSYPPDLVFPPRLPDSLEGLRLKTRSFYKIQL